MASAVLQFQAGQFGGHAETDDGRDVLGAATMAVFLSAAMQQRLRVFGPLSPEEEARFDERFARISQA